MNKREFTVLDDTGKEIKLIVKQPMAEDLDESSNIYAAKVASLVRQSGKSKILLRAELDKFLKDSGVWTQTDEDKVASLNTQIDELLSKLRKGGLKLSEGRSIAIEAADKRNEIVNIFAKRRLFDETTIENIAENEQKDYLVYACTVLADTGKRYWASFEDMKNDKINDAFKTAYLHTIQLIFNVNPEFEKKLPENQWLKRYNFIDDNMNFVDRKTGNRVDRNGNPINLIESEIQKRIDNLQGEIKEEQPFIDDDTGEVIKV